MDNRITIENVTERSDAELRGLAASIKISDVFSEDKEITDTVYDLYSKAKYVHIFEEDPLTLEEIVSVASKYFERIGVSAPKALGTQGDSREVCDTDGTPLVSFKANQEKKLPYGYLDDSLDLTEAELKNSPADTISKEQFSKSITQAISIKIEKEKFSPTNYRTEFKLSNELTFDKYITLPSYSVAALLTESDKNGFVTGMNTVIDTLFALLAKGADRRKTGVTLNFVIPSDSEEETDKKLARVLANALGAYRAMIEICIPDAASKITKKRGNTPSLFCAAYTDKINKNIPDRFTLTGNGVYLLSFKRLSGTQPAGMPDFDNLRKMCDYLHLLIKSGKARSVRAFNGRISDTLSAMSQDDLEFLRYERSNIPEDVCAQGFIVESPFEINAVRIGIVSKKNIDKIEEKE